MDVAVLVGVGCVLAAAAGFFLKAYSGIVETTKELLRIVRDQMVQMDADIRNLRSQGSTLEALLRAKESRVAELEAMLRSNDEDAGLQSEGRVPSQRSALPDASTDLPPRSELSQ